MNFAFSKNWQLFLKTCSEEQMRLARSSLQEFMGMKDFKGKSFLDIGADYDWFLRCHNAGVKMKFIDRYISFYSCAGLSSRDRYRQIPERVELVYKNSSLILFSAYAILALAKFIGGAFWEYIVGPIRKLLWRNTKAR